MKVKRLAKYFDQLEREASRNRITELLANLFREVKTSEIDKICYLSLGSLGPAFARVQFNLAEKMMVRILSQAYGKNEKDVRQAYKKLGDLGELAEKFAKGKGKSIEISRLYEELLEIAQEAGTGSVERKINKMANLLADLNPQTARFVARIPVGKLRLGFSELTILDGLSFLVAGDKSKRGQIEEAYNVRADVGFIAKLVKTSGTKKLSQIKVSLGTPIMPALCQRLPTAEEMIVKMGKLAAEPKYDGTRLQVHFSKKRKWEDQEEEQPAFDFKPKGFVRTFTRNLDNTTHMFPDLVEAVFRQVKASEAILDCEAIGYDPKTGKFLPFQETITRKRKYGIGVKAKEVPLKFFCFDILYKDGKDLLKTPFSGRRAILEKILSPAGKTILLSPQIVTDDPKKLRAYHNEQVKKGLEGVVVKKWEAPYDPGRRGYTWVKFKQEETKKGGGLADTIDCLVMGYYKGRGKRATFGIGAFLVGVRRGEQFLSVSKVGTGLSDDQWREMKKRCSKIKVDKPPKQYRVDKNLAPDVWCQPSLVVEIQADNVTKSPVHTAGMALRFPRLVRFRDDRRPSQATSFKELERLYKLQK